MQMTRRAVVLSSAFSLVAPAVSLARLETATPVYAVVMRLPDLDRLFVDIGKKAGVPGMSVAVVAR